MAKQTIRGFTLDLDGGVELWNTFVVMQRLRGQSASAGIRDLLRTEVERAILAGEVTDIRPKAAT